MRLLLRSILLAPFLALPASGQGAARDSVSAAAADLLNAGRGNEARILLQQSLRSATSPALRATYRLHVGDSYLFDGRYDDAMRTYASVLAGDDAKSNAPLTSWAHRGLGMAEAFRGRNAQAAAHLTEALSGSGNSSATLSDSIEMLMVTGQHEAAAAALGRLGEGGTGKHDVYALRALNTVLSGHCTGALEALAQVSVQDAAVPRAVRGRCAAKRGQKAQAMALRDSVLNQPTPDPFSWTMMIARDAARKIR